MAQSVWSRLKTRGVERKSVEPAIAKLLGPPATIAKPQFREVFLREIATATKQTATHAQTIELMLLADEIWDAWPKLD